MTEGADKKTHLVISEDQHTFVRDPEEPNTYAGKTQRLLITRRGYPRPIDLYKLENFSNTTDVEIWTVNGNNAPERLVLPQKVHAVVLDYLLRRSRKELKDVDCFAFVCLLEGMEIPKRGADERILESHLDRWSFSETPEAIEPGDVFFLWRKEGEKHTSFTHAAVYIGRGLFLSTYGLDGDLEATTLADMKTFFRATHATKMEPKLAK